jgi:hypothetical protein
MKRFIPVTSLAIVAALVAPALAQDKGAPPKPGKEHEFLKQLEGEWEVRAKHMEPGHSGEESRATESAQISLGGFWLAFEHKGAYGKESYEGHGLMGYDPSKAKYVGTWVDSMSPHLTWFEGEADSSGKTLTFKTHGFDKSGKACEGRMTIQITDRDHHTIRFYKLDDQGKDVLGAEMTYTRKSAEIR